MIRILATCLLAACALCPVGALGVALPSATSVVDCNSNDPSGDVSGPSSCALHGASATLAESPGVLAQANVTDACVGTQDASVTLNYYFSVTGGQAGTSVPLLIGTDLATTADASAYAFANLRTDGSGATQASATVCTDGNCAAPAFDGTLSLTSGVRDVRHVTLLVIAGSTFAKGGRAAASADACIRVDPAFASAADYSVVVSAGIGNAPSSPVPEPSGMAPMVAGLSGLGLGCHGPGRRTNRCGAAS